LWNRKWIGVLLLGLIVLPWLPIFGRPRDATPPRQVRGIGEAPILAFAFSPDGTTIATIQVDGRVALRDAAAGLSAHSFLDYRGPAQALAFSPDGRSLAVGGVEPDIFLYDPRDGGALHPLGMPIRWVKGLVFSPDGRILAASSYLHNEILLWDLAAGRERARLVGHRSPVISLAFAPDGRSLASGSMSDPAILIWDLGTGRPRRRLGVPPGVVHALAYSPDGGWLASAGRLERAVRLWDLAGGRGDRLIGTHSRRETRWPSRQTGGCWPRPETTVRFVCGMSRPAQSCASSVAQTIGSPEWRSRPTGGCWPRPEMMPTSGSGT
jgi:WD40 repeat protein